MKFQEYRVRPDEAEKTQVELADRAALVAHCKERLATTMDHIQDIAIEVRPYGPEWTDPKLGEARKWITHIVTIKGYGVMGFTDSAC